MGKRRLEDLRLEDLHVTVADSLRRLPGPAGQRFAPLLSGETCDVEIYAPRGTDPQKPNPRDEAYVVTSGKGFFRSGSERRPFGPSDVLLVGAGHDRSRVTAIVGRGRAVVVLFGLTVMMAASPTAPQAETLPARFVAEVVRVDVTPAGADVQGEYVFVRSSDTRSTLRMIYPFATDSTLGEPRLVEASFTREREAEKQLNVRRVPYGWSWQLDFASKDSCRIRIRYRQPLRAPHAVYVLTSTGAWGTGLEHARFVVSIPSSYPEPEFTFPFQPVFRSTGRTEYAFEAAGFSPDRDLVVDWSGGGGP